VITGVIVHLHNDLPIVVDMEELPSASDRVITCTNVRTVDGKRPMFVHHKNSTFVFPLDQVRLIEAPAQNGDEQAMHADGPSTLDRLPIDDILLPPAADEEPDEDLLARIRQI
jgi:hypothetical protein